MDYSNAAKEVLAAVGGKGNIVSAAHCATRLRLVVADDSKVDQKKVENCEGVKGCFTAAGQIQIIYGTGTVNKVYDEFLPMAGVSGASKDEAKAAAAAKGNWFQRVIKALGDVFVPIIPAIVASGLLMGLCSGLSAAFPVLSTSGEFQLIQLFSNASFVFLQILIGFSAAKVFGGNPYLGAVIGMIMIHTSLVNAWNIPTITAALGDQAYQVVTATNTAAKITAAGGIPVYSILGGLYNVPLTGYQGHIIPVVIACWFMSKLEIKLHKVVPDIIDLFVTPLTTVLVTGFLTLTIFGPFFGMVENGVLAGVKFLIAIPMGVGAFFVGLVYAPTVVMGIHHMYNALEAGMLAGANPMDTWMPIATAANVGQGAACLAVALKTRSTKMKELALPASLSAFLGITEPAIFGVNLRFMKPFVSGMIGAAFGAAVASILGVYSTAMGITGLFGFLDTTACTLQYAIVMVVSFVIAFGICFTIYKDPEDEEAPELEADAPAPVAPAGVASLAEVSTEKVSAPGPHFVCSPMTGMAIKMSEVSDPTFAKELMGGGIAVQPTAGKVVAPCDGTITLVFETKHAIGLTSDDGVEVLIHIGLDTVNMKGSPFTAHCKQGDNVKKGDLLMEVDLDAVKAAGYDTTTPVIITNSEAYKTMNVVTGRSVTAGEKVITVE